MKTKYTPIVGHDFIDASGARCFCLQMCSHGQDGFRTRAFVTMENGKPNRVIIGNSFMGTRRGLVRLAGIYLTRSTPVRFSA